MKLIIDAQPLLDAEKTGISWYTKRITDVMCSSDQVNIQLNYSGCRKYCSSDKIMAVYQKKGCKVRHSWLPVRVRRRLRIPYKLLFNTKSSSSVSIFFNYEVPCGVSGKKIAVIYDMAYKTCPETVSKDTRLWLENIMEETCQRADMIVTISQFSKQEIVKYMQVDPQKIRIVPCGVDLNVYKPNYKQTEITAVREKYRVPEKYLLYVGTLEPRKNIEHMIEAYAQLLNELEFPPALVIGGKRGWMYEQIFAKVNEYGIQDHVVFTGYLDEGDVPLLMKAAEAFVFPSLYEGFGMPPLEAMACGVPVICSNRSSLPEVVGQAGLLVNPLSVRELMESMKRVILDKRLRETLSRRGVEQAQKYTWNAAAEAMIKVCHEFEDN